MIGITIVPMAFLRPTGASGAILQSPGGQEMKYALWKYPVHFLAYGFGTGLAPFGPGTFGSLIGIVLFWFMAPLGTGFYAGLVVMLFLAGIFVCGQTAGDMQAVDPGFIVFDEVIGFLVAMFSLPANWQWIAAGFVLYRILDIWKPYPIYLVEEKLGLGTAIMVDDIMAGFYALAILHLLRLALDKPTS